MFDIIYIIINNYVSEVGIMSEEFLVNIVSGMWSKFRYTHHPISVRPNTFTDNSRKWDDEPHFHDFPHMWYCARGSYTHYIKDVAYNCSEGSFVIVPPGIKHDFITTDSEGCDLICIDLMFNFFNAPYEADQVNAITRLFLNEFSDIIGFSPKYVFELCEEEKAAADELFNELIKYDWKAPVLSYASVQKKLCKFFSSGVFELPEDILASAKKFLEKKFIPLLRTVYYINLNYNVKICKEELVELSGLSKTEYFNLIKKNVGCTYSTYLQMIRVRRAISALSGTNHPISYIANICGFGDVSYMEKRIKKYWPSMWLPNDIQKRYNVKETHRNYDSIHEETTKHFHLFD